MPWLLVERQRKILVDFAVVIIVVPISKTWQNKQLLDVPLSHNNKKKIFKRIVAFTNFVGMIATLFTRRWDGCSRVHRFSP